MVLGLIKCVSADGSCSFVAVCLVVADAKTYNPVAHEQTHDLFLTV